MGTTLKFDDGYEIQVDEDYNEVEGVRYVDFVAAVTDTERGLEHGAGI